MIAQVRVAVGVLRSFPLPVYPCTFNCICAANGKYLHQIYHLGGGCNNHLEKYEFVNGKDYISHISWKIKKKTVKPPTSISLIIMEPVKIPTWSLIWIHNGSHPNSRKKIRRYIPKKHHKICITRIPIKSFYNTQCISWIPISYHIISYHTISYHIISSGISHGDMPNMFLDENVLKSGYPQIIHVNIGLLTISCNPICPLRRLIKPCPVRSMRSTGNQWSLHCWCG